MIQKTRRQGASFKSEAIDEDISCSSSGSLRSYLDDPQSFSCSGASASDIVSGDLDRTTRTKGQKNPQHQRHRVKFDDGDVDCCDSITGGSIRSDTSGASGTSLLSDYSTYEQAQEEKKIFHRNDRWSTSSSACPSPSSTRSISPSPVRSSSRCVVLSSTMCSMPVRTHDDADKPAIYYAPLTSSVSSEAQTKKEKSGVALRNRRVRRPRTHMESKWMASPNTEQEVTSSTSSVCSYSSSSTTSSTTSSDLPPRMPLRRSLM